MPVVGVGEGCGLVVLRKGGGEAGAQPFLTGARREELAERLGVKEGQANAIARELLCTHQAEEWGSRLNSKGTLAPVLQAKEASNVA